MAKPTQQQAIAYALRRFKGQCRDYPGGLTGLLADIACLSVGRIKNIPSELSRSKIVTFRK